jgi:hypothetical protein
MRVRCDEYCAFLLNKWPNSVRDVPRGEISDLIDRLAHRETGLQLHRHAHQQWLTYLAILLSNVAQTVADVNGKLVADPQEFSCNFFLALFFQLDCLRHSTTPAGAHRKHVD